MSVRRHLALVAMVALTVQSLAYAGGNGKGKGGNGQGSSNSSNNSGGGDNKGGNGNGHGGGNNGNGHGNTGPGNQGNDKPVGNAGGNGNGNGGNGDAGGNGNGHGGGNNGNGHGNTGPGNQGNDKPVGNAGGNGNPGGENPGGENPGGENPGGENPGGENPGGENPGGENPGGENPGGENPGGENPGGENPGGENPGGENPGDENPGNEGPQNTQATTGEFNFRLLPIVFGSFDSFTRTYNMSGASDKSQSLESDEVRLELDNYSEGFRVIKTVDFSLGLGIAGVLTHTAVAGFAGAIGVAPIVGSKVIFNNIVADEKELKELKRKIPYAATQVDEMKVGEFVTLSQRGGLMIGLGAGYYGLGAGAKTIMQGTFTYRIEKLADNLVSVKVEKERLDSATLYAGAPVATISANEATKILSGLSFEMDIADQSARDAYEELMKGDFTFAQADKHLSSLTSVRKIDNYSLNAKSYTRKFYFGIPFFFTSLEKGKTYERQNVHTIADGSVKSSNYGIYVRERNTVLATVHRNQLETFTGGMATTRSDKGQVLASDTNGTFSWLYEDSHSSSKKLASYLKKLAAKTGMMRLMDISTPKKEKLGFAEVNFSYNMNELYLTKLMDKASRSKTMVEVWGEAQGQMENYFARGVDEMRVCPWNIGKARLSKAGIRICTRAFTKKNRNSNADIAKQLEKMAAAKAKSSGSFARESAKFGQQVWSNPFYFKALTETGFKCGADMTLTISGKRISVYQERTIGTTEACQ